MKLYALGFVLLAAAAGCAPDEPDFGNQLAYEFRSQYVLQRTMGPAVTDSCFRPVKIEGVLEFKVNDVGVTFVAADAALAVTQSRPPLDNSLACDKIPLFFETIPMRGEVSGAPDDATFSFQDSVNTSGLSYVRRYTYEGTLNKDGGVGILTYELTGVNNGVTTTNIIRLGVALTPITGVVKVPLLGKA